MRPRPPVRHSCARSRLATAGAADDTSAPVATEAPVGTEPPPAPPAGDEPSIIEVRDVTVTPDVADVSANEQQWSGELPHGRSWSATILRVYDHVELRWYVDGQFMTSEGGATLASLTSGGAVCCHPRAFTTNPDAAAMRVVRADGERDVVALHPLVGTEDVWVAVLAMPDDSDLVDRVELIDADGVVLQAYDPDVGCTLGCA